MHQSSKDCHNCTLKVLEVAAEPHAPVCVPNNAIGRLTMPPRRERPDLNHRIERQIYPFKFCTANQLIRRSNQSAPLNHLYWQCILLVYCTVKVLSVLWLIPTLSSPNLKSLRYCCYISRWTLVAAESLRCWARRLDLINVSLSLSLLLFSLFRLFSFLSFFLFFFLVSRLCTVNVYVLVFFKNKSPEGRGFSPEYIVQITYKRNSNQL